MHKLKGLAQRFGLPWRHPSVLFYDKASKCSTDQFKVFRRNGLYSLYFGCTIPSSFHHSDSKVKPEGSCQYICQPAIASRLEPVLSAILVADINKNQRYKSIFGSSLESKLE